MSLFDKLKFHAWDSVEVVLSHLKEWQPTSCKTEKDFENSLYAYLHSKLPEIQVTKQFAQGRVRADLNVGGKVIVELKNNLDNTSKYQRLVGQLAEYKEWDGRVVVLLTGKTDRNIRKELDRFLEREGLTEEMLGAKVTVFDK